MSNESVPCSDALLELGTRPGTGGTGTAPFGARRPLRTAAGAEDEARALEKNFVFGADATRRMKRVMPVPFGDIDPVCAAVRGAALVPVSGVGGSAKDCCDELACPGGGPVPERPSVRCFSAFDFVRGREDVDVKGRALAWAAVPLCSGREGVLGWVCVRSMCAR